MKHALSISVSDVTESIYDKIKDIEEIEDNIRIGLEGRIQENNERWVERNCHDATLHCIDEDFDIFCENHAHELPPNKKIIKIWYNFLVD